MFFPLSKPGDSSIVRGETSPMRSSTDDVNDGVDKGLRILLRQVVPDAALDMPVLIAARELLGMSWAPDAVRRWHHFRG
jgi:hypothetical protein